MKRILALLLCIAMLLSLAGCNNTRPNDNNSTSNTRTVTLAQNGKTDYTIVYSSTASEGSVEKSAALYLKTVLEQVTSATFRIVDDTTSTAGPEILIGSTNRKVSQQAQAGLARYDYRITVQSGNIAIVAGGDLAIQTAVNAFVSTYLLDDTASGDKQMKTIKLSASLDTIGSCDPQAVYGYLDYSEDMIGEAVDITPWAYLWRRGVEEQTKPEAEFIPRRLERIDTVYRTALDELGPVHIQSIFYDQPDLLKQFPASPEHPLLLGALWVGSLSDYTVTLTWTGNYVPDPVEVEVRTYPTAWGWFGWTVDQIMPVAEVSADGRTWTYHCPKGQMMDHSYSDRVASATEMIAVFAPEGIDVPEIHITGDSLGTWKDMDVTVEWALGEDVPVFTGEYETVLAATNLVELNLEARYARFKIAYSDVCDTGSDSRLTMWTDQKNIGITVALSDLAEGPIYVPDSGICFYQTGSFASASECITEIEGNGSKDVLEIYREHAEPTDWQEVFDNVRRQSSGFGDGAVPAFPKVSTTSSFTVDIPDDRWEDMFYIAIQQLLGKHMWYDLTNEVGRTAYAMELCGLYDKCDEIYDYFLESPGVKSDGDFSTGTGSLEWANDMRHDMGYAHEGTHASSGMLIYAMMHRYFMTGDAAWIEERLDRLLEAVDWMIEEATDYMSYVSNNEALLCYGLLPPAMMGDYALPSSDWHWYFSDNAYMLQALNAFAAVLTDMGHSSAAYYTEQAEIFAENLLTAVQYHTSTSPVRRKGDGTSMIFTSRMLYDGGLIHYGEADSRPQYSGGIHDLFLGALPLGEAYSLLDASDPIIVGIVNAMEEFGADYSVYIQDDYDHPTADGGTQGVGPGQTENVVYGYWGSYTNLVKLSHLADTYLRQDDIENFLRYFFNNAMLFVGRNGQFWEHAHPENYDNCTAPDCGTAGWYVLNFRNMLLTEDEDALWIAKGTPRAWLNQGEKIAVSDAPSAFGNLSYSILSDVDNDRITAEIDVPDREAIGQIKLRLRHPDAATIRSVKITSGTGTATIAEDGETVIITGVKGKISIEVLY